VTLWQLPINRGQGGRVELKPNKALDENSSLSYGMSLAIRNHTVLPATRHKWTRPANATLNSDFALSNILPGIPMVAIHSCWATTVRLTPVSALESWMASGGLREAPAPLLPSSPRLPPARGLSCIMCIWRVPPIQLWGPVFNIQEKKKFHMQCALWTRISVSITCWNEKFEY